MAKYDPIYTSVLRVESDSIAKLKDTLDKAVLDRVVDVLCEVKKTGRKVLVAGCGTSGIAARKIAHTLCVAEVPAFYLCPSDAVHGGLGAVQRGDVVVLITKGGDTPEILQYIQPCRDKGAVIVGVTQNGASALGRACDILLRVQVQQEAAPWGIASASALAVLAAWDAVAFAVLQVYGPTKEEFYRIHPGGSAGQLVKEMLK